MPPPFCFSWRLLPAACPILSRTERMGSVGCTGLFPVCPSYARNRQTVTLADALRPGYSLNLDGDVPSRVESASLLGNKMTWTDIFAFSLLGGSCLAVPLLTLLAYRGWVHRLRHKLPRWRSALGVTSIVATLLSWLLLINPLLAPLFRMKSYPESLAEIVIPGVPASLLLGLTLGFALRGSSRVQVLLAGLLMVALCAVAFNP